MIPEDPKAIHQWTEPWFFLLRSVTRAGWFVRLGFFIAVYAVFVVLLVQATDSTGKPLIGHVGVALFPIPIASLSIVMFEVPTLQRQVVLSNDNRISCFGTLLMFAGPIQLIRGGFDTFNQREIKQVELLRTGEPGNDFPFGLMIVVRKFSSTKHIAVPTTESVEEIANHLHAMTIDVQLSDWEPSAEKADANKGDSAADGAM